jgi:hypothetical protein
VLASLRILRLRLFLPLLFERQGLQELLGRLDEHGASGRALGPGSSAGGQASPRPPDGDALLSRVESLFRPLRFWRTTCLWRALGGYAALRSAGEDARFLIGVRTDPAGEIVAHAWLERGGRPSLGAPRPTDGFKVAFAWPADPGTLLRAHEEADVPGIAPSEDVLLTELKDGTGVLLHLNTKFYFTLNRTGVLVWKLIAGGAHEAAAISAAIAAQYPDQDPGAVRQDVDALLAELRAEKLVVERG